MAFVGLGIFVSFLQAFIFAMLSTIYIALAEAHEPMKPNSTIDINLGGKK